MEGEPCSPLPSVLRHDVDRVRGRDHRASVGESYHSDIDAIRGTDRNVSPIGAEVARDDVLEKAAAHLPHRILRPGLICHLERTPQDPRAENSSGSLRRHYPDRVPRVTPSRGRLSALLGSPGEGAQADI